MSTSHGTLLRPSLWNNVDSGPCRTVVIGGGHGLSAVLCALRDRSTAVTAIVTVADNGGSSGELRRRRDSPAVGDLRRALISLADEDVGLARALARSVSIDRLGTHPLGNLILSALAETLGDVELASAWLGKQLGISGQVLPVSNESVTLLAEARDVVIYGERAIGMAQLRIGRVRFSPQRPSVPAATLQAIERADLVLLGPGSLFTSVLAAAAVPDVVAALARSAARVVWICNLEPEAIETAGMSACDHLEALRAHGVRIDTVLYDSAAELRFEPGQLDGQGLEAMPRPILSARPGVHDPVLLGAALGELLNRIPPARKDVVRHVNASA